MFLMKIIMENKNNLFTKGLFMLCFIVSSFTTLFAQINKDTSRYTNTIVISDYASPPYPTAIDSTTFIYRAPQVFAKFPGNIMKYISDSLCYPKLAIQKGIYGTVWVQFVVEKDGSVSTLSVQRSDNTLLNAEAIRVVSTMPKFIPAKEKGIPVRSYDYVPIHFNLPPASGSAIKQ